MRYIVAGPPCSGKSTYVRNHYKRGDLVYDFDTMHSALSGLSAHDHLENIKHFVIVARDAVFGELEKRKNQNAWIITSTKEDAVLKGLRDRLSAEVVFLEVSREEAHRRCEEDSRPSIWHTYVDAWFDSNDIDPKNYQTLDVLSREKRKQMDKKGIKTYRAPLQLKEGGNPGEFRAVIGTMNVLDHDGDVLRPGCLEKPMVPVRIAAWAHRWHELPVGKGWVKEKKTELVCEGEFFMDTQGGAETYQTVKNLGDLAEWSFGYDVLKSSKGKHNGEPARFLEKLRIHEVSPVLLGAGIGTRTEEIKSGGAALSSDPRAVLRRLERQEFADVDYAELFLQLAKIDALANGTLPRVPDDPRAALAMLKGAAGTTRRELIEQRIRALHPGQSDFWVQEAVENAITLRAQELIRQQEMTAGCSPNSSVALAEARRWAAERIER